MLANCTPTDVYADGVAGRGPRSDFRGQGWTLGPPRGGRGGTSFGSSSAAPAPVLRDPRASISARSTCLGGPLGRLFGWSGVPTAEAYRSLSSGASRRRPSCERWRSFLRLSLGLSAVVVG